jgi:RNA-directed DNA polymerase
MRKKLPKKDAVKRGVANVREEGRNVSGLTREAVNLEAVFGEPNLNPKDLMEAVVERSNMIKALAQVQRNKGAPGVDGLKVEDLDVYLARHWGQIRQWLLNGEYHSRPVRRVEIPKPDGGVRILGIPTSVDRMIQQAMGQVLGEIFEPTFSESSFGFRPKRSAHQAITKAKAFVTEGRRIVVDIDLEKFFDRVNHDILMDRLSRRVKDKRVLKVIRGYLEAGVMTGGLEEARTEGTPQGGPLSPLLSNVLLDELDKELERRGHKFCRYADDCNIYVKSRKAGERVKASITGWLERRLKLKVNEHKSAVDNMSRRKFLGYSMTADKVPKLKPAKVSVERFKGKVRELFCKARGRNVERFILNDLNPLVRGWGEYFKLSGVKLIFEELDGWIRRKLRSLIWRQWKKPRTRYHNLMALGLAEDTARKSAFNGRGPWWNSARMHMVTPFPNHHFNQLGLISLQTKIQRVANAS